jgi:2-methylcitrate dehydratase
MRERVPAEAIEEIRIGTYRTALNLMANEPSRWAPATHETADHSLPYVVARALLDGAVNDASFSDAKLRDPRAAALMARTKVAEDGALTAQFPESSPCHITVRLQDGSEVRNEIQYPKGHERSPMSAAEVHSKFRSLFETYGTKRQADKVIALVENLDELQEIGELFAALRLRAPSEKTTPRPKPARHEPAPGASAA